MPLKELNPDEFPDFIGARGQVSYQICKEFLAAGMKLAKVDPNDFPGRKMTAISSSINAFVRRHELPMKNTYQKGDIFLYRTDIDDDGKVKPKDIEDYVSSTFQLPVGKADPELVQRTDIPTLSVHTARERLDTENDPGE